MTDDGFSPLVDDSSGGFQASTTQGQGDSGGFNRLQFKQEEPKQPTAPEPVAPDAEAASGWQQLGATEVPSQEFQVAEAGGVPEAEGAPSEMPGEAVEALSGDASGDAPEEAVVPEKDPGLFEVERQAFEMGFEKGERDGFLKGEERAMEMLVRLENLILGFEGAWRKSCEDREKQIVSLALVVAEKVALAKADQDDEIAARSLVEALAALENPGTCTVRVHPGDFDSVERLRGDLFQRVANLQEIIILPDSVVEEGEVRLESDNGWLETHARKRLDEVLSRVSAASGLSASGQMESSGVA